LLSDLESIEVCSQRLIFYHSDGHEGNTVKIPRTREEKDEGGEKAVNNSKLGGKAELKIEMIARGLAPLSGAANARAENALCQL
jgi:hypothetical protein